jgi:hypothetical protein
MKSIARRAAKYNPSARSRDQLNFSASALDALDYVTGAVGAGKGLI